MKRLTYKQLGRSLGAFIEQPFVSLSDGGQGYKADAVFRSRFLFEDKDTSAMSHRTAAKQQLTCYASEMRRAQKPEADLDWVMVATDLREYWEIRHFTSGAPQSPWIKTELGVLPELAPGDLAAEFTDIERAIWNSANIHHTEDGTLVKTCTACAEEKALEAYTVSLAHKDGRHSQCAECYNSRQRESRAARRSEEGKEWC